MVVSRHAVLLCGFVATALGLGYMATADAPATYLLMNAAAFAIGYAALAWYLINKPSHVDFLISTDSEMKKVNWTSRRELIGSTKVVIVFMFLIAAILFVIDLFFGYIFYLFSVLKTKPF